MDEYEDIILVIHNIWCFLNSITFWMIVILWHYFYIILFLITNLFSIKYLFLIPLSKNAGGQLVELTKPKSLATTSSFQIHFFHSKDITSWSNNIATNYAHEGPFASIVSYHCPSSDSSEETHQAFETTVEDFVDYFKEPPSQVQSMEKQKPQEQTMPITTATDLMAENASQWIHLKTYRLSPWRSSGTTVSSSTKLNTVYIQLQREISATHVIRNNNTIFNYRCKHRWVVQGGEWFFYI